MGNCYWAEETLIDSVGQKIEDFYNLISKIGLMKVLKSVNKKRELAGNIDLTVVKGGAAGAEIKNSIRRLFQEPT